MDYRNQLFVKYGVMRWLQSNLYDKYREMKRELKRQKEEMEEKKGEMMEQQRKKRKVMEERFRFGGGNRPAATCNDSLATTDRGGFVLTGSTCRENKRKSKMEMH